MTEDLADMKPTIEGVRSMVSCFDVIEMLDVPMTARNKIHSPWNDADSTPSCQVHEDFVHCFSTGKGGDVLDLFMALTGCNLQQAIFRLWRGGVSAGFEPGDVERDVRPATIPDFSDELRVAETIGWTSFHDKAMPRGVDIKRLRDHDFVRPGDGCILIPHWTPGCKADGTSAAHGVKVRWFDGRKTAWPTSVFTHALYCARKAESNPASSVSTAWLVEGESDAWALTDALRLAGRKEDVYALPAGCATWKDRWLDTLNRYASVALVLDNDRAGKDARDKIERKLDSVERFQAGGTFHNIYIPTLFNDLREATISGWTPPPILRAVPSMPSTDCALRGGGDAA